MKFNVPWERSVTKAGYRLKLQGARADLPLSGFEQSGSR
jgi:hypothetical protein